MPHQSSAEQMSLTGTISGGHESPVQDHSNQTISQSSTREKENHQEQQMCLGASNLISTATMTGTAATDESTGGSRSEHDDQSHASSTTCSSSRRKRSIQVKAGQSLGRWTPEEHQAFLQGLKVFGREWKKVAERIPTRTSAQIRSHAQKYFAKIQREESIILQDAAVTATQLSNQPSTTPIPETTPVPPEISPSVQHNVQRILANPTGVQREVEDTMRELRERYHQLQIRLAETNRRRFGVTPSSGLVVENEAPRRKRPLEEVHHQNDDVSSVSSTISAYTRELGDEELIALSVLGGTLPRSASGQDLRETPLDEQSQVTLRSHASSTSSTITSARENCQVGDSDGEESKKRKVTDGKNPNDSGFADEESTNPQDPTGP